ncbi:MAG TPA: DNA cytosine methyltransferase, partial [Paraburkholderia sp.]
RLASILHRTDGREPLLPWDGERFFDHGERRVQPKYTLTPGLWAYLQQYAEKHRAAGNGFGYGLAFPDSVTRTLSARYHKDGSEILVYQGEGLRPRRLTPRECARLMGLPDTFRIPVSDTQAYRQFGNSVVMPVMREVARTMMPHLDVLLGARREAAPAVADAAQATVAAVARANERVVVPNAVRKARRKTAPAAPSMATAGGR